MPINYEIRIEGQLDLCWTEWLEGMTITQIPTGETIISGPLVDQSALHGVLNRIMEMNLKLVSVEKKGHSGL